MMLRQVAAGRPAARGRYAVFLKGRTAAAKMRRSFTRAANDATADPVTGDEAALYLSDTLELLQFWDSNAHFDTSLDDHCDNQQDSPFPQPL